MLEVLKSLQGSEETAQKYKLSGLLAEEETFATGKVQKAPAEGNAADLALAERAMTAVNADRAKAVGLAAKSGFPFVLKDYCEMVRKKDREDFKRLSGKVIYSIQAPPVLCHRLLPSLIRAYLSQDTNAVLSSQRDGNQRAFRARDKTTNDIRSVIITADSAKRNAEDGPTLEFAVHDGAIPQQTGNLYLAVGAIAIIANPLQPTEKVVTSDLQKLLSKGGGRTWVAVTPDSFVNSLPSAASSGLTPGKPVADYDLLDSLVYAETNAIAFVPVCVSTFTDNRVLRVATSHSDYGVRPTVLSIRSGAYPWRFSVFAKGTTTDPECARFLAFLRSAEGKKTIIDCGYWPFEKP